jgi:hypothetical protein
MPSCSGASAQWYCDPTFSGSRPTAHNHQRSPRVAGRSRTDRSVTAATVLRSPGDALPDGQVGYLRAIDLGAGTVTVDLAELLTRTAAGDAYQDDTGQVLDGEQFYVRNRNPRLRTAPIDPSGSGPRPSTLPAPTR